MQGVDIRTCINVTMEKDYTFAVLDCIISQVPVILSMFCRWTWLLILSPAHLPQNTSGNALQAFLRSTKHIWTGLANSPDVSIGNLVQSSNILNIYIFTVNPITCCVSHTKHTNKGLQPLTMLQQNVASSTSTRQEA